MGIEDKWDMEPGQQTVFAPGQKPKKPDPNRLFSDEQYRHLIEQEPDEERRRLMTDAMEEGSFDMLNEMIADDPDRDIPQEQDALPPLPKDE